MFISTPPLWMQYTYVEDTHTCHHWNLRNLNTQYRLGPRQVPIKVVEAPLFNVLETPKERLSIYKCTLYAVPYVVFYTFTLNFMKVQCFKKVNVNLCHNLLESWCSDKICILGRYWHWEWSIPQVHMSHGQMGITMFTLIELIMGRVADGIVVHFIILFY